jgi:hypothetical protein
VAESTDKVNWRKLNNGHPVKGLHGVEQLSPSVYFDGRQYLMFYSAMENDRWRLYAAISQNKVDWLPAWNDKSLVPEIPFMFNDGKMGTNLATHPSVFVEKRRISVWFMGEDTGQRTGLLSSAM